MQVKFIKTSTIKIPMQIMKTYYVQFDGNDGYRFSANISETDIQAVVEKTERVIKMLEQHTIEKVRVSCIKELAINCPNN